MDQVNDVDGQHINIEGNELPDKPNNNKSQLRISKKKREATKKTLLKEKGHDSVETEKGDDFDEYGAPNSFLKGKVW